MRRPGTGRGGHEGVSLEHSGEHSGACCPPRPAAEPPAGDLAEPPAAEPPAAEPPAGDLAEPPAGDLAEPPADDPDKLRKMLLESERRSGELVAQLQRTLADYRNLERRIRTDVDNGVRERVAQFAADMVLLRDDFERAAKAAAAAAAGAGSSSGGDQESGATVAAGIETVLRNMDQAFSKHGVTAIDSLGEIFNPGRHEAVSAVEDATLDEGTITKELARGYALDERIIRPSQVVISKRPAVEDR